MSGLQANQQMDVVVDAADALGNSAQSANRAAEIVVQTIPPRRGDGRSAILRAEDEVIVQAEIGGWHVLVSIMVTKDGAEPPRRNTISTASAAMLRLPW